jgi:hypothetical protein
MKRLLLALLFIGCGSSVEAAWSRKKIVTLAGAVVIVPSVFYFVAPDVVKDVAQAGSNKYKGWYHSDSFGAPCARKSYNWVTSSLQKLWKKDKKQTEKSA